MNEPGRVTDIRSRRGSKRREIFVDGDLLCVTSSAVVAVLGIACGDVVDPDDMTARIRSLESRFCRERAVFLLTYRDRSSKELSERLVSDGYDPSVAEDVVGSLVACGLADDLRFASGTARALVQSRGLGRARAHRELVRHGVDEGLAEEVLDEFAPREDERARARAAAHTAVRSGDTVERLAARLCRRGFSTSEAIDAAREAFSDSD